MHRLDLKSLVIGGFLALSVACLIAAAPSGDGNAPGRFAMAAGPGHAFVLDTATGQVWALRAPADEYAAMEWVDGNDALFLAPKLGEGVPEEPNTPAM